MSSVKDLVRTLEAEIELALKLPLRKASGVAIGDPAQPAFYGITTAKNTVVPVSFDERKYLVTYNRVDIGTFFVGLTTNDLVKMKVTVDMPATTHDLLPDLGKTLGIKVDPSDFLNEPLDFTNQVTAVRFKTSPTNQLFTGFIDLKLRYPLKKVGEHLSFEFAFSPKPVDGSTTSENKSVPRQNAGMFTYWRDYGAQTAALAGITMNPEFYAWTNISSTQASALVNALKAVDGLPWVYDTTVTNVNLKPNVLNYGCVMYNGPVDAYECRPHDAFKQFDVEYFKQNPQLRKDKSHVLIFQPNPSYAASNLDYGPMHIYYGTNVDPNFYDQPDIPALHRWDLTGPTDLANKGTSGGNPWGPAMDFAADVNPPARLKALGSFQIGESLPCDQDFSLSFLIQRRPGVSNLDYEGYFSNNLATDISGNIKSYYDGQFYIAITTAYWRLPRQDYHRQGYTARVTVVRKESIYRIYYNDRLVVECTLANPAVKAFTTFGKAGQNCPLTTYVGGILYYNYALNPQQVKKVYQGELK